MLVFHDAVEKNGGPLPIAYYLQPDAGSTPDAGPLQFNKSIDLLNTRIDRRSFFESLLHDKNFAIVSAFLVSGVSVNAVRDEDGATALHIATAATLDILNDDSFMNISGDRGARTGSSSGGGGASHNAEDVFGSPDALELEEDMRHRTDRVLNPACPNQLILNFLIDNGANVNAPMRNRHRQTPLMVAAARQNVKVAKLLLAKGADLYAEDSAGRTVLTYAARYPLLLEAFRVWMGEENFYNCAVQERLLHTVCRTVGNHYAALYFIEQVRLDVNARDDLPAGPRSPRVYSEESRAPLGSPHSSSATSNTAAVPSANGAGVVVARSPRSNSGAHNGRVSPVHSNNASTAVEMVNMVAATYGGDTPLHCAVSTGDVALVRALLSKGADVHAENGNGVTPLRLAQSQSQVGRSMKQYWRDELLLLLRPGSPGAVAARRRRLDQQHERNPAKVRAMLTAFNNATPGPPREKILEEEPAQYIWQLCTPMDYVHFAVTTVLPHLFFYLCCCILRNFFLLLCVLPLLYASYVGMQKRDGHRPRSRPLTGLGWCFGFVVAQALCLPLFTTRFYYQYYSFDLEDHAAISWWLIPSAILTFVLVGYLVCLSTPGIVTTSEGQRKGIYASLRNAKGTYPKELLYGIDLRTMVKKPLRAQYCVQLQRVVLRYDQYCTYLSTVVGGGNQRLFFWVHVALLSLLSCFYHYAREYGRMMSRIADVAQASGGVGGKMDQAVLQKIAWTPFSTAGLRFGYMYTQVILPVMILMNAYALYNQLCLIARNLTVYDLDHAEDESSVYCFTLGSTAYTLYDRGMWANAVEFLSWSSFTQLIYRVPQINPYLQKIVEDYQRWQLTSGDACCGNDDHHGHSHGGGDGGHNNHGNGSGGAGGAAERIGPAEFGEDESTRTQEMLAAKQRQALAAAQSVARPPPPSQTAAVPSTQSPTASAATAAAVAVEGQHPDQAYEEEEGEYFEEGGEEGENIGDNSVLAMQIFQQMVRSGSTDVGRGGDNVQSSTAAYGAATSDGADAETQREWDAAVLKARQMFDFYRQSMGAQGED